ncbi:MAG TPA: hypothetical protein VH350_15585 [Candidatus Sulfotelmatobacter sp.]|jgi:hypothetical protein|nr:hypothetical protein [Candidatus Sulfotelmatobacter sp.]
MNGDEPKSVSSERCHAKDLACGKGAVLWYVPVIAIIAGLSWGSARVWLWVPGFLIMGIACVVNAARCGRLHCYFTGPIYLLAAVYAALAGFNLVPMRPDIFLIVVFGLTCLACCAEIPFGRYAKKLQIGQ